MKNFTKEGCDLHVVLELKFGCQILIPPVSKHMELAYNFVGVVPSHLFYCFMELEFQFELKQEFYLFILLHFILSSQNMRKIFCQVKPIGKFSVWYFNRM